MNLSNYSKYFLLFIASLLFLSFSIGEQKIVGKVIGIKDGDTIEILYKGKKLIIRLAHIDCPEKNQPYGKKAKKYISDKCFGKQVSIMHFNKYDRNKRLIGEVITTSGKNLNKELIEAGLAWHFKKFSNNFEYAYLEKKARKHKRGLWSQKNPIEPSIWRRN